MSQVSERASSNPDSFAFGSTFGALHGIASWSEALHGCGELADALSTWVRLLGAAEARLLRLDLGTAAEETVARIAVRQQLVSSTCSTISFSQYLLGHGLGKARARSVWYLSEFDREILVDAQSSLGLLFGDGRTRDIVVVALDPGKRLSDLLEIHFTRRLSTEEKNSLSMLANVLSRTWQRRRANVVDETIALHQRRLARAEEERPRGSSVLGAANPAGLSKAEYRVCMLMTRGLSAKLISRRLRVSESTVRSHLRSIYAKTEASGQRELMYRLLAPSLSDEDAPAGPKPDRGFRNGTTARNDVIDRD